MFNLVCFITIQQSSQKWQELTEARKVSTVTINEETFKAEYENKLEATINDLREQHEVDMEQYKDDVESAFQSKVCCLEKIVKLQSTFENLSQHKHDVWRKQKLN